jgi:sporulation protein YlmC with PRC-barrel domain
MTLSRSELRKSGYHSAAWVLILGAGLAALWAPAPNASPNQAEETRSRVFDLRASDNRDHLFARSGSHRAMETNQAERYYSSHRIVGSHVLTLGGDNIGQVDDLVVDNSGHVKKVLVAVRDTAELDGGPVLVAPHRAQVVSVEGAQVKVIRIDLTKEELQRAQLASLKTRVRAPERRGTGSPYPQGKQNSHCSDL